MALVTLKDVHKTYGQKHLLRGVALVLGEGERVGLVGPNGFGKSTLLRIVAGREPADEGERTVRRGLEISWLEQEPRFEAGITIRQSVGGGHEADALLDRLGLLDTDRRCDSISVGELRRVALARTLLGDPDLLLLDEPTNHLDALATEWLEDTLLAKRKAALLMVTHDRYFLDRVVDRIVEIDRGQLHVYEGGYLDFLVARAGRLDAERKSERTRLNLLRRETEWMRRGPAGRSTKAKARIRRHRALVDAAPESIPTDLEFTIPPGPRLGKKVIRLSDPALEIGAGERVGIAGPNGAGKTTLLERCLADAEVGSTVRFAYIDQKRASLTPTRSVLAEVGDGNSWVRVGERDVRVETFLERFLFPRQALHTPVGELSGGERNRVLLAKLLLQGGNVLLLDEPTNDLDLMTLRVLEEALIAFEGTVLVVCHDRYFLDRVATRIVYLDGKHTMRLHPGDMSSLIERMKAEAAPARKPKRKRTRQRAAGGLSWKERTELEALPDRIARAEAELKRLDLELGDPALYAGPARRVREIASERKALAATVDELYRRWQELEVG